MTVQDQYGDGTDDAGEFAPIVRQPPRTDIDVQNTAVVTTGSAVFQAHTVTGGINYYSRPASSARPMPRQLPPPPLGFVGRIDHLTDLDRRVATTVPRVPPDGQQRAPMVMISVIGGTGGIGKTWLALAWAHHTVYRFPDGQLFADLHGFSPTGRPAHPVDVLGRFLDALGIERDHQPEDLDRRAELYRSLVADKRMLIMLDNAATTDQVTPLLPGGHQCAVLVTSRNHLRGLVATLSRILLDLRWRSPA